LTETAEGDLAEIWLYWATEASEAIAGRQLAAFEAQFQKLQDYPQLGVSREQFAPGLRVVFQGAYAIYYIPQDNELIVLRVLHTAREMLDDPAIAAADKRNVILILHQTVTTVIIGWKMLSFHNHIELRRVTRNLCARIGDNMRCIEDTHRTSQG
jgi:toxin ParE1/3/4